MFHRAGGGAGGVPCWKGWVVGGCGTRILVLLEQIIVVLIRFRRFPGVLGGNRAVPLPLWPTAYSPDGGRHPLRDVYSELVPAPVVRRLSDPFGILSGPRDISPDASL